MKLKHFFFSLPALVLVAWLVYPHVLMSSWAKWFFPQGDWARRGVIGDSFGALNTLFAGLALAGLAVNIYLQNVQLKKLEDRELNNERQLAAQAQALRLTALLTYYNNEIDRLERLSNELVELKPDHKTKTKFWDRFAELAAKRDAIVSELVAIQPSKQ